MSQLVVTSLTNSDAEYYDSFIPFVLSLQDTDFKGKVAVLTHGVSENKVDFLKSKGIDGFPVETLYENEHLDDIVTIIKASEELKCSDIAWYDVATWFPGPEFTIFSQLNSRSVLYSTCHKYYQESIRRMNVSQDVLNHIPVAEDSREYQTSLIAGNIEAWKYYQQWLLEKIQGEESDQFSVLENKVLFNLYMAEKPESGSILPVTYCAVENAGIRLRNTGGSGGLALLCENKKVEAILNQPQDTLYLYRAWRKHDFSRLKEDWQFNQAPYWTIELDSCRTPQEREFAENPIDLKLESVEANFISYAF